MSTLTFAVRQLHSFREFPEVDSVSISARQGIIQIFPGHADMITETIPGICVIAHGGVSESLQLQSAGLMKVRSNRATLIL